MRQYDNALHMMEEFGGSFIKALAHLYYMSDSSNKPRVRAAFPEYFECYEAMYRQHREQTKEKSPTNLETDTCTESPPTTPAK